MRFDMKKIGIIGTRQRDITKDLKKVEAALFKIYKEGDIIVSGGCPEGGDRFAQVLSRRHGLSILIHFPNWKKYGKAAGFVRNTKIAEDSDILIACVSGDRKGDTEDTIKKFKKNHTKQYLKNNLILV